MNTYKITFTRENGTVGSDNFTAPSEAQARRDFKEFYRHGNGTITSVELVSNDAPATKQQERAALEKIRKIVEELGPDSYIATAFGLPRTESSTTPTAPLKSSGTSSRRVKRTTRQLTPQRTKSRRRRTQR